MKIRHGALIAASVATALVAGAAQANEREAKTSTNERFLREAQAAKPAEQRQGMVSGRVNPQTVVHPNGMLSQELDASTMVSTIARRNAQGKIEMVCVNSVEDVERALKAPADFAQRMSPKRGAQEAGNEK